MTGNKVKCFTFGVSKTGQVVLENLICRLSEVGLLPNSKVNRRAFWQPIAVYQSSLTNHRLIPADRFIKTSLNFCKDTAQPRFYFFTFQSTRVDFADGQNFKGKKHQRGSEIISRPLFINTEYKSIDVTI